MSLSIDSRFITGVYALGQWFRVKPNSVDVDAYEFRNWASDDPQPGDWREEATDYQMGGTYSRPDLPGPLCGSYGGDSRKGWHVPSGSTGITFIEEETGERICFSLLEVKGFRERRPAG